LSLKRMVGILVGTAVVCSAVGGLIGLLLSIWLPSYFSIFGPAGIKDPADIGVGLGLTQGLVIGILLGIVLIILQIWSSNREQ
jgi:hypothetical protein